jgi:hypothetical protein
MDVNSRSNFWRWRVSLNHTVADNYHEALFPKDKVIG